MSDGNVTTATLVRGKVYKHFFNGEYETFERGVEREVSSELADELEMLTDEVNTNEGDVIERDRFAIDRDASPRRLEPEGKRKRLRLQVEEVDIKPVRKRIPLRKAQTGNSGGFKKRTVSR